MKSAILLSAMPALAAAQIISTGTGAGEYPNATYYEAYNSSSNATGSHLIRSVNMSFSPPGLGYSQPWTATINITQVPFQANTSLVQDNTVLSLNSNGEFMNGTNWNTCVLFLADLMTNVTVDGQKDNGNCSATLGDKCRNDWNLALLAARSAATARGVAGNRADGACGGMYLPAVPASCVGRFTTNGAAWQDILNLSTVNDNSPWFYFLDTPHSPRNLTPYEIAVTRIFPISLIQSPNETFNNGNGATAIDTICLKAENVSSGSEPIKDVPGAGNKVNVGVWMAMFVVGMTALMM